MASKTAFCAICHEETEHEISIEQISEDVVLTCSKCGHFIKLPKGISKEGIEEYLVAHKEANDREIDNTPIMTAEEKETYIESLV